MHQKIAGENLAFWEARKAKYPFRAQAGTRQPRPTEVEVPGDFLAVPLSASVVIWGFQFEADRDAFLERFPAAEIAGSK
ncbi:hypothetical protein [Shimia sp.]|uniref:hypothetical protein n=1 Tax=Shimia sp. TaxID=1954381 RepID=UPI00329A0CD9